MRLSDWSSVLFSSDLKLSYNDQRDLDRLPARIDALTAEAAALEQRLADPALYKKNPAGFDEITRTLAAKRRELATAEERWLELEAEREALESGKGESGKASNGEFAARSEENTEELQPLMRTSVGVFRLK